MASDISNKDQLEEIKRLFAQNNTELRQALDKLRSEFLSHINDHNSVIKDLQQENIWLRNKIEVIEGKARKNNLVFFGLPYSKHRGIDLLNWALPTINKLLEVNLKPHEVSNIYFRGTQENSKKPLILEFNNCFTKGPLFKNAFKLKGKGVFITNDLSKREQEINKVLVAHLREARSKKLVAYIRGDKIYIGEEVFTYEQLVSKSTLSSTKDPEFLSPPPARKSTSAPSTPVIRDASYSDTEHTEVVEVPIVPANISQPHSTTAPTAAPKPILNSVPKQSTGQPPAQINRKGRLNSVGSLSSPSNTASLRSSARIQQVKSTNK